MTVRLSQPRIRAVELRPFRSLRFSPRVIGERGLERLIAPPASQISAELVKTLYGAAAENIARITVPPAAPGDPNAAAQTLQSWLSQGILSKERRPGLWIYRQSLGQNGATLVLSLLVGLVRLLEAEAGVELPPEPAPARSREERLAFVKTLRADFEPCLLVTKAPLSGALATTRQPDISATDASGVRHDALRINDFAQHVELQGLVKNAEVVLAQGRDLWEAARDFAKDPAAAKLSGAKYKLCAILDEAFVRSAGRLPVPYSGLFGFSLEDPVY